MRAPRSPQAAREPLDVHDHAALAHRVGETGLPALALDDRDLLLQFLAQRVEHRLIMPADADAVAGDRRDADRHGARAQQRLDRGEHARRADQVHAEDVRRGGHVRAQAGRADDRAQVVVADGVREPLRRLGLAQIADHLHRVDAVERVGGDIAHDELVPLAEALDAGPADATRRARNDRHRVHRHRFNQTIG